MHVLRCLPSPFQSDSSHPQLIVWLLLRTSAERGRGEREAGGGGTRKSLKNNKKNTPEKKKTFSVYELFLLQYSHVKRLTVNIFSHLLHNTFSLHLIASYLQSSLPLPTSLSPLLPLSLSQLCTCMRNTHLSGFY